ncbi:MAG: aminotransferase class V-fold PLP-dependent enzyme [Anaerolineae bacterium]|jgi:glutamate/tyrosine decarboxylase-like PLP-dependent enzyme
MNDLMMDAARRGVQYLQSLNTRKLYPSSEALECLQELDQPLQDESVDPFEVLDILDTLGSPATIASTAGRYFGFVIGGSLPVARAANMLAAAWDQNAALYASSPIGSVLEEVCRKWLLSLFGLPPESGIGFVSGATMASFSGLASARHAVLRDAGWDVESQGLFGAPRATVIVGEEAHASIFKALSMLGMGRERVVRVPADDQGRMRAELLPDISGPTIVCVGAGNVNTGAFDPIKEICAAAKSNGAWVHVDGAFGLWAAASPERAHLVAGIEEADSWSVDAHKWLNVPYDSGMAIVRNPADLRAAMSMSASYYIKAGERDPWDWVPQISRRARGIEIWAALRSLGRGGVADLVERCCRHAARFGEALAAAGYQVLNDVVLNQVLVSFGDEDTTNRVIRRIQEDGTCWCGGAVWQGQAVMRISVSCWATTEEDVKRSLNAVLRIAAEERKS